VSCLVIRKRSKDHSAYFLLGTGLPGDQRQHHRGQKKIGLSYVDLKKDSTTTNRHMGFLKKCRFTSKSMPSPIERGQGSRCSCDRGTE